MHAVCVQKGKIEMELTNKDVYDFLQKEIACHPELIEQFGGDLVEHEGDEEFWEQLLEALEDIGVYCFKICDACGKPMIEGYTMLGSHYCSETCLHEDYTDEQLEKLLTDDNTECYYTNWYEDSISYNKSK